MDDGILEEYKNLVFKREKLQKDARKYFIAYIREFGELIEKEYSLKIECIKLKKTIAYCQARQNRGDAIFCDELNAYIESVMKDYYDELQTIVSVRNAPAEKVAEIDYYKLKKIYRRLASMLHPDLHPALFEHEEVFALWERISQAYKSNDYDELQKLEVIAVDMVKRYEQEDLAISVENIQTKIVLLKAEIDEIICTDPYRYNELLHDDDAVAEKKTDLQSSIDEYEDYLSELTKEASVFNIEGCA